jgi:cytochrome P450
MLIVGAGAETTAASLGVITFHLLDNPEILKRLREELEVALPDSDKPVKLKELEQLPYLVFGLSLRRLC